MQPVPRSFQAHRPVLDEAWPAQPPGSPRYDPKQNFRLPLELEILTNRRCAPKAEQVKKLLAKIMVSVFDKLFKKQVPIEVDAKICENWGENEGIGDVCCSH